MLTLDDLARSEDIAERNVMRRLAARSVIRNENCIVLPLTVAFFVLFVSACFNHIQVVDVFFLESNLRSHIDSMFSYQESIPLLWSGQGAILDTNPSGFIGFFFNQNDGNGNPLTPGSPGDPWGMWGRVATYTQIQGAVRFEQQRAVLDPYGSSYKCTDHLTCQLCRSNEGFIKMGVNSTALNLSSTCTGKVTRRLESGNRLSTEEADGRELSILFPSRAQTGPKIKSDVLPGNKFRYYLYPGLTQANITKMLTYYQNRSWIDANSEKFSIRMYLLVVEQALRLQSVTINFRFPESGGILYWTDLQAIYLSVWPTNVALVVDALWIVALSFVSLAWLRQLWQAFLRKQVVPHLLNAVTLLGAAVVGVGWYLVYSIAAMVRVKDDLQDTLAQIRTYGWTLGTDQEPLLDSFFDSAESAGSSWYSITLVMGFYVILLICTFYINFGVQPRLAVTTRTMWNVMDDLVHFTFALGSVMVLYSLSGQLLFGRYTPDFATFQASIGQVYLYLQSAWYDWSPAGGYSGIKWVYFWASAGWGVTMASLLAILLLNLIMAIIINIYTDVRQSMTSQEDLISSISDFLIRYLHFSKWVTEDVLEKRLARKRDPPIIKWEDLLSEFPTMPDKQLATIFSACKQDMGHDANGLVDKHSLLKMARQVFAACDENRANLHSINVDESADPLQTWMVPKVADPEGAAASSLGLPSDFITTQVKTKGQRPIPTCGLEEVQDQKDEWCPLWLQEVQAMVTAQRLWLESASATILQMQKQMAQIDPKDKSVVL